MPALPAGNLAPTLAAWRGASPTRSPARSASIESGALDDNDVEGLADRLSGVGERQLRRLFRKHLGASPVAVAQTRRVLCWPMQRIHETRLPMAEVAMASGFGSSARRFNETSPAALRSAAGRSAPARRGRSIGRRRRGGASHPALPAALRLGRDPGLPGDAGDPESRAGGGRPATNARSASAARSAVIRVGAGGEAPARHHHAVPEDQRSAGGDRPSAAGVRPRRRPGRDQRTSRQGPGAGPPGGPASGPQGRQAHGTASSWRSARSSASRSPSWPPAVSPPSWSPPTVRRCQRTWLPRV